VGLNLFELCPRGGFERKHNAFMGCFCIFVHLAAMSMRVACRGEILGRDTFQEGRKARTWPMPSSAQDFLNAFDRSARLRAANV